jgi:hypothetical protein
MAILGLGKFQYIHDGTLITIRTFVLFEYKPRSKFEVFMKLSHIANELFSLPGLRIAYTENVLLISVN